jgi:hypothetical protein
MNDCVRSCTVCVSTCSSMYIHIHVLVCVYRYRKHDNSMSIKSLPHSRYNYFRFFGHLQDSILHFNEGPVCFFLSLLICVCTHARDTCVLVDPYPGIEHARAHTHVYVVLHLRVYASGKHTFIAWIHRACTMTHKTICIRIINNNYYMCVREYLCSHLW